VDTSLLLAKQRVWEGYRPTVYDDATGTPIRQSSYVKGNPTIGIGRNLTIPLSDAAIDFLWNESVQEAFGNASTFPWFAGLSEPRQLALCDMEFNIGHGTLLTFTTFLSLMAVGNFNGAADDLETTDWYKQDGERAEYVTNSIRTGTWP
jgi:lysozyme